MPYSDTVEYIQREHLEMLRLVDKIAGALALASKDDFAARQKGLAELREAREGLLGMRQHCGSEDGILESDFHHYLDMEQYGRLRAQHAAISRQVAGLLRELAYATADTVTELCPSGEELLEQIREHVSYEEEMLWRVEGRRLVYH